MEQMPCPCGLDALYTECCGPLIKGERHAKTAEALMRSRYSAYTQVEMDYILSTTHPDQREDYDEANSRKWAAESEWYGLEIVSTEAGGEEDNDGVVEFIAKYAQKRMRHSHHERATFSKIEGQWYFEDGEIVAPKPIKRETPKVGRNEPCPCGSGKKFKKCCGKKGA